MAAVPPWLRGRDIANNGGTPGVFSITPYNEAVNGQLTAAAGASSMLGNWEDASPDSNPESEEISSADATRQNEVILKESFNFTVSEILKRSGVNIIAYMFANYDVFYVVLTRGGQTWGFFGRRGPYNEQIGKGKSLGRGTFQMIDPGQSNPIYS